MKSLNSTSSAHGPKPIAPPAKPSSGHTSGAALSRKEAWRLSKKIAELDDVLDAFARALEARGIVGEERNVKLLYLIMTARLFAKPASCIVQGPASAGKSALVHSVQDFFPPAAYLERTGMSEKALIRSDEPLRHRILIIYEATGLGTGLAAYYLRTLLSEGKVRYEVTVSPTAGTRVIERIGPTGLIATTTAESLDPELESRVLLIPINESKEKIRAVLLSEATGKKIDRKALEQWRAFQTWLSYTSPRVHIPYAKALAGLIAPLDVRLHRYFRSVKVLVQAHALLHRRKRRVTKSGAVIAEIGDYAAVRALLKDIFAQGIEAATPIAVRRVVAAVSNAEPNGTGVSLDQIADQLKASKSTACRHAQTAARLGYLRNLDGRTGAVAKYVLGEPIPTDIQVLPLAKAVFAAVRAAKQLKSD